jgi:hypothetical protein
MTTQQSLFPDVTPTVNPAADLPRVPCGSNVPGRGCGQPMVWVITLGGARMPIDPEPTPDGNIIFADSTWDVVRYLRKGEAVPEGTARYRSHFASCPDAASFRRR